MLMDMEEMQNRGHAVLKGAIAKKKRKNAANYCSASDQQVVIRRNKIQPLIIHTVSPPLFDAEPSTFMRIVQSLTGCPATRLRCEDEAAAMSAAGSPMMISDMPTEVGSPCSSMSSTTSTTSATSADERNLDANAGPNGSWRERIWEYEVNVECRDIQEPMQSSPSMSSCSLLLDSSEHDAFFVDSGAHIEELLYFADSFSGDGVILPSAHYHQHFQDLESTLDSYLEHLLSSYDRDAYCKFTSTSALLADVCDPLLLTELS